MTAFYMACFRGHAKAAKLVLSLGGAAVDVNSATQGGYTPLNAASLRGNDRVVEFLLERPEIEVNTADTKFGRYS